MNAGEDTRNPGDYVASEKYAGHAPPVGASLWTGLLDSSLPLVVVIRGMRIIIIAQAVSRLIVFGRFQVSW